MPRRKRVLIPGLPHHVTQRGVRRQNVFFTPEDRELYKSLLAENAHRYGVEIIGYCLMTNHVHHLSVPLEEDSLQVLYALNRLQEREILIKSWLVNHRALSLTRHSIMFSLSVHEEQKKRRVLQSIVKSPLTTYLVELGGDYDYKLSLLTHDVQDALTFLTELAREHGSVFTSKEVSTRGSVLLFTRKYLSPVKPLCSELEVGTKAIAPASPDELDRSLLENLMVDADSSLRDLAKKLGKSASTIDIRLTRLKKSGLLLGPIYTVRGSQFGAQYYTLLLYTRGLSIEQREELYKLVSTHPHGVNIIECFGSWDYEIGIEVLEYAQLASFRALLHEKCGAALHATKLVSRFKVHKYKPFPLTQKQN